MRMRNLSLVEFNPDPERTLRKRLAELQLEGTSSSTASTPTPSPPDSPIPREMPKLSDEGVPSAEAVPTGTLRPNLTATSFKVDPSFYNLVRKEQFDGTPTEDPAKHINEFCDLCQMITHEDVTQDQLKRMMFPHSLKDKASSWKHLGGNCSICWRDMNTGALFTAECSHIFHYNCISYNLQNGSHICPTCQASWTQVPFQFPRNNNRSLTYPMIPPPWTPYQPRPTFVDPNFDDDEPLPSSATSSSQTPFPPHQGVAMKVKALPEYPAISKLDKYDSFAVLASIRAPMLSTDTGDVASARAPLDLVVVLGVSGSMFGDKIRLLKQAVNFVIKNLGPKDRLSILTFSTESHRLTPLRRMTEAGQNDTLRAVGSIQTSASTNIIAGLQTAVKVLEQRRKQNPVTSIILLSDGQDTDNHDFISCLNRLPQCIRSNVVGSSQNATPRNLVQVYTFEFGADHDARALHAISDGSGGTFSYIEAIEVIQDAFAQCIGGLLSVVAQEVEIQVHSGSTGVVIMSIPSGRYRNTIDSFGSQHGVVYVGDVYADEEKQFLVYLSVPPVEEENSNLTTKLLEVKCTYKNPLSKEKIVSETVTAEVRRPLKEDLLAEDKWVCLEVDRERNRISIAEGIAEAQEMAERGELERARSVLERKRNTVLNSYAGMERDRVTMFNFDQATQLQNCMMTNEGYSAGGRGFALSANSSHMYQRAATQALNFNGPSAQGQVSGASECAPFGTFMDASAPQSAPNSGYHTAFMQQMVMKSQQERQSSAQNPKPSFFGGPMGSSDSSENP